MISAYRKSPARSFLLIEHHASRSEIHSNTTDTELMPISQHIHGGSVRIVIENATPMFWFQVSRAVSKQELSVPMIDGWTNTAFLDSKICSNGSGVVCEAAGGRPILYYRRERVLLWIYDMHLAVPGSHGDPLTKRG